MHLLCVSQAESLDAVWGGSPADPDLLIPVCGEHKLVIRTHSLHCQGQQKESHSLAEHKLVIRTHGLHCQEPQKDSHLLGGLANTIRMLGFAPVHPEGFSGS